MNFPHIPPLSEEPLHRLVDVFLQENEKHNLSAFRTPETCWVGNVMDSVTTLSLVSTFARCALSRSQRVNVQTCNVPTFTVLDLGTGGGFPLLPLAICLPNAQFTGLDATKKKIDALQRIVDALEIQNVTLLCGRAEELGRDPVHRARYDVVAARAIAPLNVLIEYAAPLLTIGGHLIAWKSMHIEQELKDSLLARAELSCHLVQTHEYELPEGFGKRQLLVLEKTAKTLEKYPRRGGVAKKKSLI